MITSGNQYIYLPYHFNKEVQEMGFSEVAYVPTLKNISDLFTEAVDSGTIRLQHIDSDLNNQMQVLENLLEKVK